MYKQFQQHLVTQIQDIKSSGTYKTNASLYRLNTEN